MATQPKDTPTPAPSPRPADDPAARLRSAIDALDAAQRDAQDSNAPRPSFEDDSPDDAPDRAHLLMDWLRADMSARHFGSASFAFTDVEPQLATAPGDVSFAAAESPVADVSIAPQRSEWPTPPAKEEYTIGELLHYPDEAFVRNAYLALLRREPDPQGFAHYVATLREGGVTRQEVLERVRFSEEGRAANVRVAGLRQMRAFRRLQRIPVLGRIVATAIYIFRLPFIARHLEVLEADVARRGWQHDRRLQELGTTAESALRAGEQRRAQGHADLLQAVRALDARESNAGRAIRSLQASDLALRRWAGVFGENLASMHTAVSRLEQLTTRQAMREELLRVAQPLLQAVEALQADQRRLAEAIGHRLYMPDDHDLDDFYVNFENRFRGKRDDIKERVRVYVPQVREAYRATDAAPVLDIGCGRGEWLEVLKESGIAARGVDSNGGMARKCREMGLDVVESEGMRLLRSLKSDSLGAVTAFHVIEHLQFKDLLALFDEALRVLKPGGVIVFETPNPENLIVGACNFWYDPTHVHPLPPELVRYVAEARGFANAEIQRLHPFPDYELLPPGIDEQVRSRLNALLYGAQDYSIVARKP